MRPWRALRFPSWHPPMPPPNTIFPNREIPHRLALSTSSQLPYAQTPDHLFWAGALAWREPSRWVLTRGLQPATHTNSCLLDARQWGSGLFLHPLSFNFCLQFTSSQHEADQEDQRPSRCPDGGATGIPSTQCSAWHRVQTH